MSEEKKSGCMKKIGIGCLVLLGIVIVAGVIIGIRFHSAVKAAGGYESWKNRKTAEFMDYAVRQSLSGLPLNNTEKATITKVTDRLAEQLRRGEINPEKSTEMILAAYHGALPEVFIALYFQSRFLKNDADAALTVNRFAGGLLTGKIAFDDTMPFLRLVLVDSNVLAQMHGLASAPRKDPAQEIKFREKLSAQEITNAVAAMKTAADRAGVSPVRGNLDFTPVLEKILAQAAPEAARTGTKPANGVKSSP